MTGAAVNHTLSSSERAALDLTIRKAEQLCRAEISVFVGHSDGDPHDFATSLHNSLVAPARTILVMVDPTARAIEVVTGAHVRHTLSDHQADLAIATMASCFADGDLVGGLRRGIQQLAESARPQNMLHAQATALSEERAQSVDETRLSKGRERGTSSRRHALGNPVLTRCRTDPVLSRRPWPGRRGRARPRRDPRGRSAGRRG